MKGISRRWRLALASTLACGLLACGGDVTTNISVGGTISGFTTGTLSLTNGLSAMTLNAGATTFTFPARVAIGLTYNVAVLTQPVGLTCTVTNGSGYAMSTDVTNVEVKCATNNRLGGSISGLKNSGLILANGGTTLTIPANSTTFEFPTKVVSGSPFGVVVFQQPSPQVCTVSNGAAFMKDSDYFDVVVTCN